MQAEEQAHPHARKQSPAIKKGSGGGSSGGRDDADWTLDRKGGGNVEHGTGHKRMNQREQQQRDA